MIPVLDRAEPLLDSLDSVARQRRLPARVVVVDDGSREPVEDAVFRWRDRSVPSFDVRVLRQANHGAAHARNRGVEQAGGADLIAFLDSDDRWPVDFLERTGAALESEPDAVAATTDRAFVSRAAGAPAHRPQPSREIARNATEFLLRHGGGIGSATLLRRSAFDKAGRYDESVMTGHDSALFLRMSRQGRWLHAAGAPVLYADDPATLDHLRFRFADYRRRWARVDEGFLSEYGDASGVPKTFARRHLARRWRMAGEQLLAAGEAAGARACFARSLHYRKRWATLRGWASSLLLEAR